MWARRLLNTRRAGRVGTVAVGAMGVTAMYAAGSNENPHTIADALASFTQTLSITKEALYFQSHQVHVAVEKALAAVLDKLPSNPLDIIGTTLLEYAYSDEKVARAMARLRATKVLFPDNLSAKFFDPLYFGQLTPEEQAELLAIVRSGYENPNSEMGCYAMKPTDYDHYDTFFRRVIAAYHKVSEDATHTTSWDVSALKSADCDPTNLDLAALGLPPLSMRVRVGRNLADFALPGSMTQDDRVAMESKMCEAFEHLIKDPAYGGRYYSLTPGHKDKISDAEYAQLVKEHLMFKDMSKDSYLVTAGISSSWPYGRGCYVSGDKKFIVWVGEEDHLRIMCMQKGTVLNDVFDRLKKALDTVESIDGLKFAHSKRYGYVTSCPTNLGTGMRASVHIRLPNLTRDGTEAKATAAAKPLGLSVRGAGGEHTPIGADGTVDISPSARYCITEAEIISNLYKGLKLLNELEQKAAAE